VTDVMANFTRLESNNTVSPDLSFHSHLRLTCVSN